MKIKSAPYRSTKRTRATAKLVLDYMNGDRVDLPGFTRRSRMAETVGNIAHPKQDAPKG